MFWPWPPRPTPLFTKELRRNDCWRPLVVDYVWTKTRMERANGQHNCITDKYKPTVIYENKEEKNDDEDEADRDAVGQHPTETAS